MKEFKVIKEFPWIELIREEWKRAKNIIHFSVNMPKFFWKKRLKNNWVAYYSKTFNHIVINERCKCLELTEKNIDEMKFMIRHELAHIGTKGHGNDFLFNMKRLGGTRYCNFGILPSIPKREKIQKERKERDLKMERYGKALAQVKRYESKLKRTKTILKKWQNKVRYYERNNILK